MANPMTGVSVLYEAKLKQEGSKLLYACAVVVKDSLRRIREYAEHGGANNGKGCRVMIRRTIMTQKILQYIRDLAIRYYALLNHVDDCPARAPRESPEPGPKSMQILFMIDVLQSNMEEVLSYFDDVTHAEMGIVGGSEDRLIRLYAIYYRRCAGAVFDAEVAFYRKFQNAAYDRLLQMSLASGDVLLKKTVPTIILMPPVPVKNLLVKKVPGITPRKRRTSQQLKVPMEKHRKQASAKQAVSHVRPDPHTKNRPATTEKQKTYQPAGDGIAPLVNESLKLRTWKRLATTVEEAKEAGKRRNAAIKGPIAMDVKISPARPWRKRSIATVEKEEEIEGNTNAPAEGRIGPLANEPTGRPTKRPTTNPPSSTMEGMEEAEEETSEPAKDQTEPPVNNSTDVPLKKPNGSAVDKQTETEGSKQMSSLAPTNFVRSGIASLLQGGMSAIGGVIGKTTGNTAEPKRPTKLSRPQFTKSQGLSIQQNDQESEDDAADRLDDADLTADARAFQNAWPLFREYCINHQTVKPRT